MAALADSRTVTLALAPLAEHLGCVLCRGLLRNAHTIPECLHSFCKSCIFRFFLVQCDPNEPACPKCGRTLSARPVATLISDQRLQDVVDRIFPEHKERDAALEQEFYERHSFKKKKEEPESSDGSKRDAPPSSSSPSPLLVSPSAPTNGASSELQPFDARRERGTGRNTAAAPVASAAVPGAASAAAAQPPPSSSRKRSLARSQKPISFYGETLVKVFAIEVYPDNQTSDCQLPKLQRPYLHVDGRFKMFELRKYIVKMLQPEKLAGELEMACMGAIVGPELSVHFIYRTIWQRRRDGEPLVLHYRLLAS